MTLAHPPDYRIRAATPAPASYPSQPTPDTFSDSPFLSDYESRRAAFLQHILKNPAPENTKATWHELGRLAAGGIPHEGILHAALDFIDARRDCADFVLHGVLRLLYQFVPSDGKWKVESGASTFHPSTSSGRGFPLSREVIVRAKNTIISFKYFPNEPGVDSLCTWTENHYILYTSAAYLAGQMCPDEVFSNSGETGKQKVELNRKRILRWLDLRFRTGFSEWLSHVYYDEDLVALLSLYDFAEDEKIRQKSEMVIDLILLDMALNSFKGVFGSTHGRSYENTKKWPSNEGTTDTSKLLFGMGIFSGFDNMSAVAFVLSGYSVPRVIEAIAGDSHFKSDCHLENRQRMGIKLSEMERWGIHSDNFEDGMLYLTHEAYLHPCTIANTVRMFDICNWWENWFLHDFKPYRGLLKTLNAVGALPLLARVLQRDLCRNTREEVNIYTYKTLDYMLSTAQDYRKDYGGDQQHIWQATLGVDAVCFTTHPARLEGATPNYWTGSGLLPRAAQYKNVAIIIYNIEKIPALYVPIKHFYTHAWLPKDKFDEVVEQNGWIFARKGDGYLALHSQNPYFWRENLPRSHGEHTLAIRLKPHASAVGEKNNFSARTVSQWQKNEDVGREIIVDGKQNIYICQMGRKADDGEFADFVENISAAEVVFSGMNVQYRSPGNGLIRFGWEGALSVDGHEVHFHDYPRYDNPYVKAEFDTNEIRVAADTHELQLNWETGKRITK